MLTRAWVILGPQSPDRKTASRAGAGAAVPPVDRVPHTKGRTTESVAGVSLGRFGASRRSIHIPG